MDVISQEEFDSQRGLDDKDGDQSDSDLVFSLDLQEASKESVLPSVTKDTTPKQSKETPKLKPILKTPSRQKEQSKEEKLARFYPVPCKLDSPSKVRLV